MDGAGPRVGSISTVVVGNHGECVVTRGKLAEPDTKRIALFGGIVVVGDRSQRLEREFKITKEVVVGSATLT